MTRLIPRPGDYTKVRRPSSWLAVLNYEKGTLARRIYPVPFKHWAAHLSLDKHGSVECFDGLLNRVIKILFEAQSELKNKTQEHLTNETGDVWTTHFHFAICLFYLTNSSVWNLLGQHEWAFGINWVSFPILPAKYTENTEQKQSGLAQYVLMPMFIYRLWFSTKPINFWFFFFLIDTKLVANSPRVARWGN